MNHSEANRLMASEKYLLDELSHDQVEAFEEHLFGCHECAMDVRAGSLFLEQGKVELAHPAAAEVRTRIAIRKPSGWFAWLRPAFALPAMAVLLLVIGYQNLVTYPALKGALAENRAPRILPAGALVSGEVRGPEGASIVLLRAGEPFLLPLDIPANKTFPSYVVELHNPAGGVQWSLPISAEAIKNTLPIQSPGVNRAGKYEVVVMGVNAQGEKLEVGRYPLELQFARAANP
jgi:putative zinc finger protein